MNEKTSSKVNSFINTANKFFTEVESWIAASSLKIRRQKIQITEEAAGSYEIDKIIIEDKTGKKIAELTPIGTFIIGANGRVDLSGNLKAIIVSLEKDGPSLTTKITADDHTETSTTVFYKGVDKAGWYWIEDKRFGKAYFVDKELFFELLAEVSDYELA